VAYVSHGESCTNDAQPYAQAGLRKSAQPLSSTLEPMKRIALFLLIASLPVSVLAGSESWSFVQSVGGLAVETPSHDTHGWVLPVRVDVSGLKAVTAKPTTLNSALICERTNAAIEGSNIYITIVSALAHPNTSSRCPPATLGEMTPGKYSVFYRGPSETPIRLGEVSIGL
jgi:hypothetical protein